MNSAKQSPRIEEDGSLRWYEGDTFSLTFNFTLKNASGNPISINPSDVINFKFTNSKKEVVHEFTFTGTASPTLNFTEEISNKFKEGVYRVMAKFNATNVTTLLKGNMVVVE